MVVEGILDDSQGNLDPADWLQLHSDGDDKAPRRRAGRRKQNGEGNIRRRSDGRFEGRVYVVTTDGREIRKSIYGPTFEDVHQQITKLKAQTMIGRRVATTSQTVGEYLDYWLTEIARNRVRTSTHQSYEWLSLKYLIPLFGRKRLVRLNGADIRKGLRPLCRGTFSRTPSRRGVGAAVGRYRHGGRESASAPAPAASRRGVATWAGEDGWVSAHRSCAFSPVGRVGPSSCAPGV